MANILLIDDMDNVRHAISSVLQKDGHDVTEASNGKEGLRRLEAEAFDLVITDIVMPVSDGTEIILAIKENPTYPPVIAISGGAASVPAETALAIANEQADRTLTKPFRNEELTRTVQELIR